MEQMKTIKASLLSLIQTQLADPKCVDAEELGEVFDMLKDLTEAAYYCSIVEAMAEPKDDEQMMRYSERYPMVRAYGENPMYYYYSNGGSGSGAGNGSNGSSGSNSGTTNNYYSEPHYYYDEGSEIGKDIRNGKSWMGRRMYMTDKHSKDSNQSMQELNSYISELGEDLTNMIKDSSPAEKQVLSDKLQQLAMKVK